MSNECLENEYKEFLLQLKRSEQEIDALLAEPDNSFKGPGLAERALVTFFGVLLMGAFALVFIESARADVVWTESTASGVIVHSESDSEPVESWDDMIFGRIERSREADRQLLAEQQERAAPALEQLKHDLWLGTKSIWEKMFM